MLADRPLTLLYHHTRYVVVAKPSGTVVHRIRGSVGTPLLQRLRDQLQAPVYPVHRLDRGTSGVLIMALDSEAQRALSGLFEHGLVGKSYTAIVRGWPEEEFVIDHPLRPLDVDAVARTDVAPQQALSQVTTLARVELPFALDRFASTRYALVRIRPREGRRHQVRRHLKHVSHPIIGDTTYGKGLHNRFFRDHYGLRRLLLHASTLQFTDPFDGTSRAISAEPPEDFTDPARQCGLIGAASPCA